MFKKIKKSHISALSIIIILAAFGLYYSKLSEQTSQNNQIKALADQERDAFKPEITKTDQEWHQLLTPQQYYVLREKGTDVPFSEQVLLHEKRPGTFVTADCGEPVFRSEQKYDSGTGWPSFWAPIKDSVVEIPDNSLGIQRTEIVGKKCGGHLGHVFNDGPQPTGLRYCINSSALKFIPDL